MKAVVIHGYGSPEVLRYEDYPDPVAGAGEVLVRVAASSVNPFDFKIRSGSLKDFIPITRRQQAFPHLVKAVNAASLNPKRRARVGFLVTDRY